MNARQAALYARVSSTHQAEAHTVARHVVAVRARIAADGLPWPEALPCIDAGSRGASRVRPALARWRDVAAAGAVDRRYGHSPERLARQEADQGRLVEAFPRAGVAGICWTRALGRRPEDDRLGHGPGLLAEDARAKLSARQRRGKRHAARAGAVNVRRGAPEGYRDRPTDAGPGQARDAAGPDAARVVRQVVDGGGRDRWPSGAVCRRLTQAGDVTRTGQPGGDRRVGGGRWKHPASRGMAACGKTPQGPVRPRRRAQRRRPVPPRRAVSTDAVPPAEWRRMPVPARVAPARFTAVQEPWQANQRHARPSPRGARDLLHGVGPCQPGGYADAGKRLRPRARKGHPRAYASERCGGPDAYRVGGARVCPQTHVRPDLRDRSVWPDVWAWRAQPERRAADDRRRLQPDRPTTHTPLTTREAQLRQLRQGLARVIDSSPDARIETPACEPRIPRLRPRSAPVDAPRQQGAEEAALHPALRLIRRRLEDCAAPVQEGLVEADWRRTREMIRAWVKRVAVAHDQVNVVFRIAPRPGAPSPENTRVHDCRRSTDAALG